jgi:hypothetical protein
MTDINPPVPHSTMANGNHAGPGALSAARSARIPVRRARIQLISDGVVASYIHDISQRHRPPPRE